MDSRRGGRKLSGAALRRVRRSQLLGEHRRSLHFLRHTECSRRGGSGRHPVFDVLLGVRFPSLVAGVFIVKNRRRDFDGALVFRRLCGTRRRDQNCGGRRLQFFFQLLDGGQQISRFERFDDDAVGLYARGFLVIKGLHFADGEQHRHGGSLMSIPQPLTHLKPGVARHVNVKNRQIGLALGNLFDRGGAIGDRDHVVACLREDFFAHILGSHTVIGQ